MWPKPPPDRSSTHDSEAAIYWEKAAACRIAAERAADPEVRNGWLDLANYWTMLLMRANDREIDPAREIDITTH